MTTQTVKGYTRSKPKQKVPDPFQDLIDARKQSYVAKEFARFTARKALDGKALRRVAKPHETALTRIVRALDELPGREPRT